MSNQLKVARTKESSMSKVELSNGVICGGNEITIIAGPCAVENKNQMINVVEKLGHTGVSAFRGCIYKPRTSPYSFQGLGTSGIKILDELRRDYSATLVTEVMSKEQVSQVASSTDVFQIGSRNMQNFELLKLVGSLDKPVILKRGLAATIEEFLLSAEYILKEGNQRVVLCERGIRSFDPSTRNVLDLGAVSLLKRKTHLPVIVDPSHAAGKRELVADLARAAVAVGADGLLIECHPNPKDSLSDARQALSLPEMIELVYSLKPIAMAIGRSMPESKADDFATCSSLELVCSKSTANLDMLVS